MYTGNVLDSRLGTKLLKTDNNATLMNCTTASAPAGRNWNQPKEEQQTVSQGASFVEFSLPLA